MDKNIEQAKREFCEKWGWDCLYDTSNYDQCLSDLNALMDKQREEILASNEVLNDISDSLLDFIGECNRMISLYKNQRYTLAEQLRDKLSERLDDVMRGY